MDHMHISVYRCVLVVYERERGGYRLGGYIYIYIYSYIYIYALPVGISCNTVHMWSELKAPSGTLNLFAKAGTFQNKTIKMVP